LLRRVEHLLEHPADDMKLQGRRKVRALWFNAWKYPSEDTVLAGLLGALLDEFRTKSALDQLTSYLEKQKGPLAKAVLKKVMPARVLELLPDSFASGSFAVAEGRRAFHDTFRLLFCRLSCLYLDGKRVLTDLENRSERQLWPRGKAQRRSLAIFLDDLDRCQPKRVREVLEAINLFMDLPGVCFYLGVDWDRLRDCLDDVGEEHQEQYLQKIVQVKLDLPTVSQIDGSRFVRQLLEKVRGTALAQVLEAGEGGSASENLAAILKSCHPRHIKGFLNDLSMTLAVLGRTGRLGDGPEQVSEAAVLAWHLLNEVLERQEWKEIRVSGRHLRQFLDRVLKKEPVSESQGAEKEGLEGEGGIKQGLRLEKRALLARHLEILDKLKDPQLHVLVHMASPPATGDGPKAKKVVGSDLLSLHSGAWVELEAKEPFEMGSNDGRDNEKPVHPVALSPYWMSRHLVTNADFAAYLKEVEVKEPPKHWEAGEIPEGKERHPVVYVNFRDAQAYCAWLTTKLIGRGSKGEARLPTEAQWEFAARGHEGRKYPWGNEPEPNEDLANFGEAIGDTTKVGAYPPGATLEGVHDLAGNVWEWCQDRYKDSYEGALPKDPPGPDSGLSRVLRGGAFDYSSGGLRGAFRLYFHPVIGDEDVGFRVVFVGG